MRRLAYIAALASGFWGSVALAAETGEGPRPPPTSSHYVQYGVALTGEIIAGPGGVCPDSSLAPCILDSGAGVAIRVGYRSRGPWYVGGAYELSRQDSSNLLRLAILQQVRAEGRYYFPTGLRYGPYVAASLGAMVYGSEFGADSGGLTSGIMAGLSLEVSRTTLIGLATGYRQLVFRAWTDSAGQRRADGLLGLGIAHVWVLEVTFEVRSPLPRW